MWISGREAVSKGKQVSKALRRGMLDKFMKQQGGRFAQQTGNTVWAIEIECQKVKRKDCQKVKRNQSMWGLKSQGRILDFLNEVGDCWRVLSRGRLDLLYLLKSSLCSWRKY